MIFPLRVLGKRIGEADIVGLGQRADFFRHPLAQFFFQFAGGLRPCFEGDERGDGLSLEIVGTSHHRSFGHRFGCATSADSTSIVLSRCPLTFSTSSTRPMIQKYPSLSMRAPSPVKYMPGICDQ